ncbi:hypothetical protein ACFR97_01510 [Haloplanus litoreus]|uniref:Uncharacterized protein n=1 Tax=Haloplanus litoreus TaxID=767515 RepID=A0ABD5ZWD2_9EURY
MPVFTVAHSLASTFGLRPHDRIYDTVRSYYLPSEATVETGDAPITGAVSADGRFSPDEADVGVDVDTAEQF